MLLHDHQELDDDLRARSNQNLSLSSFLGVVDGIERIVQNTGFDHLDDLWDEILNSFDRGEVSAFERIARQPSEAERVPSW